MNWKLKMARRFLARNIYKLTEMRSGTCEKYHGRKISDKKIKNFLKHEKACIKLLAQQA